jgi:hypothetical protein
METIAANEYLPVDLLGIGSVPLALFCAAAVLVVIGFVISGLMAFHYKTGFAKASVVLFAAFIASGIAGWFAIDGYQREAADNLASNISYKYPELKLQSPENVIKDYVRLQNSDENKPLEVKVSQGGETLTYRIDTSKGQPEPILTPVDGSEAPNPIMFLRPAEAK